MGQQQGHLDGTRVFGLVRSWLCVFYIDAKMIGTFVYAMHG